MRENMPVKTPRRLSLYLLAAVLWTTVPARAATVTGLYEARVPVPDQSSSARSAALQQALAVVLVKVTGARSVPGPLSASLGDAAHYVQQYRYEQAPPDAGAQPVGTASSSAPSLLLWARFDPKVVNAAIGAAHAPLWGAERPRTLVWLALQDASGAHLLPATDSSFLMQALVTAATQRGITLVFPQMDATDRAALAMPDVTGFVADRIRQASQRYGADAVLVGSIMPFGSSQFAAHWQLLSAGDQQAWQTQPGDEVAAAVDGVQVAADHYAARYAIAVDAGDIAGVPLVVQGVTSLQIYAKVLAYITALTPVRSVHVQRMAQGNAYFTVDAHGSLDNLQSALLLGGVLAPSYTVGPSASTAVPGTGAVTTQPMHYSYVPGP